MAVGENNAALSEHLTQPKEFKKWEWIKERKDKRLAKESNVSTTLCEMEVAWIKTKARDG